jgi:antirestriction protein ArdC
MPKKTTKSWTKKGFKKVSDHYAEVTDKLVEAIQNAIDNDTKLPWAKPWKSLGYMRNGGSNRPYRGVNTLILAMTPFADPRWFTFNQIREMGGSVKGQKSTMIVQPKIIKDKETKEQKFIGFKYLPIFNKEQIEGVEFPTLEVSTDNERHEKAEEVIKDTGANISFGGDRACYIPKEDKINLPTFDSFEVADSYYSVTFHELGHWTGAEHRLDRNLNEGRFGNEAYAFEELVAELTASFVCRDLEIDTMSRDDHAAYLKSWLKVLENDTKAIFHASSLAEAAAKEILGDHAPKVDEEEVTEEQVS